MIDDFADILPSKDPVKSSRDATTRLCFAELVSFTDRLQKQGDPTTLNNLPAELGSDSGMPLDASSMRLRVEARDGGLLFLIYPGEEASRARKEVASLSYSYQFNGSKTTETRILSGRNGTTPAYTTETSIDKSANTLTVRSKFNGKTSIASFADDGVPKALLLFNENSGEQLQFIFENGKVKVLRKNMDGSLGEFSGDELAKAVEKCIQAMQAIAQDNGFELRTGTTSDTVEERGLATDPDSYFVSFQAPDFDGNFDENPEKKSADTPVNSSVEKPAETTPADNLRIAKQKLAAAETAGDAIGRQQALVDLVKLEATSPEARDFLEEYSGHPPDPTKAGRVEYARLLAKDEGYKLFWHQEKYPLRKEMFMAALDVINASRSKDGLAFMDACFCARSAHFASVHAKDDPDFAKKFVDVLSKEMDGKGRSNVMTAIFNNPLSLTVDSVREVYLRGIDDPLFAKQFETLVERMRLPEYRAGVHKFLVDISTGIADRETSPDKPSRSKIAADLLVDEANFFVFDGKPERAKEILEDLYKAYNRTHPPGAQPNKILTTVARVAAELPAAEVRPEIFKTILRRYDETSSDRNSPAFKEAREAMLAVAKYWTRDDALMFIKDLTPDTIRDLKSVVDQLQPAVKRQLASSLAQRYEKALAQPGRSGDFEPIASAMRVLKESATPAELILVFGKESVEVKESTRVRSAFPDMNTWKTLWEKHITDWPFPVDLKLPNDAIATGEVPEHDLASLLAYRYLAGTDPLGLSKLKDIVFDNSSPTTLDVWGRVEFVKAIAKIESGHQNNNNEIKIEGLVDIMALRKSSACPPGVRLLIDTYIKGERDKGRITEQQVLQSVQLVQRRSIAGFNDVAATVVDIVKPGSTAEEVKGALDRFDSASRVADLPITTASRIHDMAVVRYLNLAAVELDSPLALNSAKQVQLLKDALTTIKNNDKLSIGKQLIEAFGGPEKLQQLIDKLDPSKPNDVAAVRDLVKQTLTHRFFAELLTDADTLRRLPLTPRDVLCADLFASSDTADLVRNFGTVKRMQETLDRLSVPAKPNSDYADLKRVLTELSDKPLSPHAQSLVNLFGGKNKIQQYLADLNDPQKADAVVFALKQIIKSKPIEDMFSHFERLRDNPGLLTDASTQAIANKYVWSTAIKSFETLVRPRHSDQKLYDKKNAADSFISTATASGDPNLKAAAAWVSAYAGLTQLQTANEAALSPQDRATCAKLGLTELLRAADYPANKVLIDALGGKEAIEQLLKDFDRAGWGELQPKVEKLLIAPLVREKLREGAGFYQLFGRDRSGSFKDVSFTPEEILRSPLFVDPQAMDRVRDAMVVARLLTALEKGFKTDADIWEATQALWAVQFLEYSKTGGKQLLQALGGEKQMKALEEALKYLEQSSRELKRDPKDRDYHDRQLRRTEELAAKILKAGSRDEFKNALAAQLDGIRPKEVIQRPDQILRPSLSPEDLARAVDLVNERRASINSDYNKLESAFLTRGTSPDDREQALKKLEQLGVANFATGGDDTRILGIPDLRAVHQLLKIQEAQTPEAKAKAVEDLIALVSPANPLAQKFVFQLETRKAEGEPDLVTLLSMLQRGTDAEKNKALEILRGRMPDGNAQIDILRTQAIMRDLLQTEKPTVAQVDEVRAKLDAEVKAGNTSAVDWLRWADANRHLLRLSATGGGPGTPADRLAAVQALNALAAEGNPHAQQALYVVLAGSTEGAKIVIAPDDGFAHNHALAYDFKKPLIPDLSHIKNDLVERFALAKVSMDGIEAGHKLRPNMTSEQARVLALALGSFGATNNRELVKRSSQLLWSALRQGDNASQVMDGVMRAYFHRQPGASDRRAIADFLIQQLEQPAFAERFAEIISDAGRGDKDSLYILAGVLSLSNYCHPDVLALATKAVARFGDRKELRPEFLKVMLEYSKVHDDYGILLATMGEVAAKEAGGKRTLESNLSPLVKEVRDEISRQLKYTLDHSYDEGPNPRKTYQSAVKGMFNMSNQLRPEDVELLTREITPELADAIRDVKMPKELADLADLFVQKLLLVLNDVKRQKEWIPALQSLGHLAPFLQVNERVNHVHDIVRFMNGRGATSPQAQSAAGRTLLQVTANGASPAIKEEAARVFVQCGWAKDLGPDVAKAMVEYAKGAEVSPEMVGKVSELVYGLNIKPPLSHLLRMMKVTDVSKAQLDKVIEQLGKGDRALGEQRLRQLLGQIQSYNSLPKPLQDLIKSGSTDVSKLTAADLMIGATNKPDEITPEKIKAMLGQLEKDGALTADYALFNGQTINDRLKALNDAMLKTIGDRTGLSPDEAHRRLVSMRTNAARTTNNLVDKQTQSTLDSRKSTMDQLCDVTKKGHDTSYWWYAAAVVGYPIARKINQDKVKTEQDGLVSELQRLDGEAAALAGDMRRLQALVQAVDLARDAGTHFMLAADGDRIAADVFLIKMAAEHNPSSLAAFSPSSYTALVGTGFEAWERGAWGRLYANGLTSHPVLPTYSYGMPHVLAEAKRTLCGELWTDSKYIGTNYDSFQLRHAQHRMLVNDALRAIHTHPTIARSTLAASEISKYWGEIQVLAQVGVAGDTRSEKLVDHVRGLISRHVKSPASDLGLEIMREHDFEKLGPLVERLKQMNQNGDPVARVFMERLQQYKFFELWEKAKLTGDPADKAKAIKELHIGVCIIPREGLQPAIEKIQLELPKLRLVYEELKQMRDACTDAEAKAVLDDQLKQLDKIIQTFDPEGATMKQFREMIRLLNTGSFDETTFLTWVRDKVVPTVAVIGFAAAVAVTTFGSGLPLAIAGMAIIAGGGILIREGYAELSYQLDWNGTGGAQVGDAYRRYQNEKGLRDSGYLVYNAKLGQFVPGPAWDEVAKAYGKQFAADMVLQLVLFGYGHILGKGLSCITGASGAAEQQAARAGVINIINQTQPSIKGLQAAMQGIPKAEWPLVQRWLIECGHQHAFGFGSHATYDSIQKQADEQNFYAELTAAAIVLTAFTGGRIGYRNVRDFGSVMPRWTGRNTMEIPIDKVAFMKEFAGRIEKSNIKDVVKLEELPNGNVRATLHGKSIILNFVPAEAAVGGAPRPTFEGATGRQAGEGSKLPRDLVDGKLIEVDATCRKQVEEARVEIEQAINNAKLPDAVAARVRDLVGERPRPDANSQIMTEYARRLALAHDIISMKPEVREHFVDPVLTKKEGSNPTELRRIVDTARLAVELTGNGIPWETIKKYPPEILQEIQPIIDMLPPSIRKAFIDPLIAKGLNPKEFHKAFAEAIEVARLSRPDQIRDIAIKLERATGDHAERLKQLMMETAREVGTSQAYQEAAKLPPEKRTPEQNRLIEAVDRVKETFKIPDDVWTTQVKPALTKPDITIADFNKVVAGLRKPTAPEEVAKAPEVYEPPKPDNYSELKPFKMKAEEISERIASLKKVQEAAEQAEVAKREAARWEAELNQLLEVEIRSLRSEFPGRNVDECRTIAMARLASGACEAKLQQAYDNLMQARARANAAAANLPVEIARFTDSVNSSMKSINSMQKGQSVGLVVRYNADPNAVAGYNSKTGELTFTPETLRLSPEKFGEFVAREMSIARSDFELATQLAFDLLPTMAPGGPKRADYEKLQLEFQKRTGREIHSNSANSAIKAAQSQGKPPADHADRVAALEAAAKSTKVADYTANEVLASKVSTAHLLVQQGKAAEVLDRLAKDAAYARDVLGQPLPTEVRALLDQMQRGESVDPVTAKKVLTDALNASMSRVNARMKALYEAMTPSEKLAVAEGQMGGDNVRAAVDQRAKLVKQLNEQYAGNEVWQVNARELIEATKSMSEREADFVLNLLRLRALRDSDNGQFKKEINPELERYLEGLDLILAGGPRMPKIAEVVASGKTRDNIDLVRDLSAMLKSIEKNGASPKRTKQEEMLAKCIKELIPIQKVIIESKHELAEKALQLRDALNEALAGRGDQFKGLSKDQLLKMKEVLDETLCYHVGKNSSTRTEAADALARFLSRVQDSVDAVEVVRKLASEGKLDRASALADLYGCADLYPNAAFPFKALSEAAQNPKVSIDVLEFITRKYLEAAGGVKYDGSLGGDTNNSLSVMYAMARGLPGYESWVFVPTGKQSFADHGNIDGIFIDTISGQVRPIDFYAFSKKATSDKEKSGKDFWANDDKGIGDGAHILTHRDSLKRAQNYVTDFMKSTEAMAASMGRVEPGHTWRGQNHLGKPIERTNENAFPVVGSTGFTAEFLSKVGFLPFKPGKNPDVCEVGPKDVATELKVCQDYYKKLCDYMAELHGRKEAIPAHVANIAVSIQNLMGSLKMADIAYNDLSQRLIDPVSATAPKWKVDADGKATVEFNSLMNTSSNVRDFQGNVLLDKAQGFIPGLELHPDGRITTAKVSAEHGTLQDYMKMSVDRLTIICADSPTPLNLAALAKAKADFELVQREMKAGTDLTQPQFNRLLPPGFTVRADGRMITKPVKEVEPLGTLPELLQVTIDRLNVVCAQRPTAENVKALARLKADLAFIEKELAAGRKLDYTKPPLADLLMRLGGK